MNPWVPETGQWVTYPDRTTGEVKLGIVDQRFRNPQTGLVTLSINGQRHPLDDCSPPSFDMAYTLYMHYLDLAAGLGELADTLFLEESENLIEATGFKLSHPRS